jgi:LacI family transcriptional regulator
LPWVKLTTRDRVLRRAEQRGLAAPSEAVAFTGILGILRIKGHAQRGRPAVERHRVICRAARETANEAGYRVEEIVISAEALNTLPSILAESGCNGLLVLPVPSEDLLHRVWTPAVPCVYTDIPADIMDVDSVCPDYHQGIFSALGRLRQLGFKRPGLMLDNGLSLPTRERLLSAYSLAFASSGGVIPSPVFTPVRSVYGFESWLSRYSFDVLLSTDPEHARRLTSESVVPVFGLLPERREEEPGLDLNLSAVGRLAVEMLHNRLTRPTRPSTPSRVLVSTSWSGPTRKFDKLGTGEPAAFGELHDLLGSAR